MLQLEYTPPSPQGRNYISGSLVFEGMLNAALFNPMACVVFAMAHQLSVLVSEEFVLLMAPCYCCCVPVGQLAITECPLAAGQVA